MAKKKDAVITYEGAIAELEEIQIALESNEIPIDQLSDKVKKAQYFQL